MMLAILQFIFSSFWIWLGTAILLSIIVTGIAGAFDGITRTLLILFQGRRS